MLQKCSIVRKSAISQRSFIAVRNRKTSQIECHAKPHFYHFGTSVLTFRYIALWVSDAVNLSMPVYVAFHLGRIYLLPLELYVDLPYLHVHIYISAYMCVYIQKQLSRFDSTYVTYILCIPHFLCCDHTTSTMASLLLCCDHTTVPSPLLMLWPHYCFVPTF